MILITLTKDQTANGEHARASGDGRSRETREDGARLQSRAWSFACLARFTRRTKIKERLLVV